MWTTENRHRYDRDKLRYPSDLTDAEWQQIKPLIPPAKRGGGKRTVDMREVVNGVMYVLSTGCQWRYIPKDLPPRSTVNGYFCLWGWDGTLEKMHHALYVKCREQAEREASPTACVDGQPEREKRRKRGSGIDPHGFDAGKLIKGKKRHVLVDTLGLVLHVLVTAANVQDRDGGILLLSTLFGQFPFLRKLFADSATRSALLHSALEQAVPKKPFAGLAVSEKVLLRQQIQTDLWRGIRLIVNNSKFCMLVEEDEFTTLQKSPSPTGYNHTLWPVPPPVLGHFRMSVTVSL